MKNNKSKKVLIIGIIVLVIILILGAMYLIFATNMFKSNKDLFFKYANQIFDNEIGFIDNKIEQYNEKKKNTIFEHEGKLTVDINSENLDETVLKHINNASISFAGNVDNSNNKLEELIKINYSDSVNFPFMIKRINGQVGIKLNELSKRYFIANEEDLSSLFTKAINQDNTTYGNDYSNNFNISLNPLDFLNIEFSSQEKENIKNRYLPIIKNNLGESNFTKVSTVKGEGYSLKLDNNKFKEILIKILEEIKNDDSILDKFNSILNLNITENSIDQIIDTLNQSEMPEGSITITLYESKEKLNKIEIQFNDEFKIGISKSSDENESNYTIDLESKDFSVNFTLNYAGLKDLKNIIENYTLSFNVGSTGDTYSYNIENNVNFTDEDIKIDEFGESINVSELNEEKRNQLLAIIMNSVVKSNTAKMEEAKVKGEEFLSIVPFLGGSLNLYNSSKDVLENNSEENNTTQNTENNVTTNTENDTNTTTEENTKSSSNLVNDMENLTKESFNEKFKAYEGDNVRGATVKSLIMNVIANNMVDDGRKIEVTGDIKLTGDEVPDSVETSKYYKVKCTMGSEGYINKVDITEKK